MARCFVFTVCVLILDVSLGLASPSMVGDGSTDLVLLQVQLLLLKHETQIEALLKENIRLAEKSLTLEGEVKFLREKTISLEKKIVTLEDKITSREQDQPSADETEITRPCPEESNGIDESRITRQPKDGVKKISKRVDSTTDSIIAFQAILTHTITDPEALQKENIRLAEKSLTLEGEVKFLLEKTVSLEEKIVTLEDKITSLEQDQPSADDTEITTPCPEESNGIDGSRITRQPKDGVKKMSKRVDSTTDSIIAFHAILTHTITDPGTDHIVQFDKMVTNIGSHFNSQTGEFICREVGVYKFSWMIYMNGNQYIDTELVRNGEVIGSSISGDTVWGTTGSASAITMLVPGDLVWVRVSGHNSGADIYPTRTMFNGFRLH